MKRGGTGSQGLGELYLDTAKPCLSRFASSHVERARPLSSAQRDARIPHRIFARPAVGISEAGQARFRKPQVVTFTLATELVSLVSQGISSSVHITLYAVSLALCGGWKNHWQRLTFALQSATSKVTSIVEPSALLFTPTNLRPRHN